MAQSPEAQSPRCETQDSNANAQLTWGKLGQPKISDEVYRNEIQPRIAGVTIPTIMSALNVCASYARIFAEGDAARIHGIGKTSRGLLLLLPDNQRSILAYFSKGRAFRMKSRLDELGRPDG